MIVSIKNFFTAALIGLFTALMSLSVSAAESLVCTFPSGMVHTFENEVFQNAPANPLSFEIGDIDLRAQSASLVTAKGKGNLKIVRAIGANHYLEVITEGYLNVTTIYDGEASDGSLPAVHSRHIGLLGTPVVSQYYGTCKTK